MLATFLSLQEIRVDHEYNDITDNIKSLLFDRNDTTAQDFEIVLSNVQRLRSQQNAGRPTLDSIDSPDVLWRKLVAAVAKVTYFPHKGDDDWKRRLDKLIHFLRDENVREKGITVITTNYDLIVDKAALAATEKNGGLERLKILHRYQYGYPIRTLFWEQGDRYPDQRYEPWSYDGDRIHIYKLHGSTNWAYCDYCKALDLAAEKQDLLALQHPTKRHRCGACGSPYEPVMIPPVPNKGVRSLLAIRCG